MAVLQEVGAAHGKTAPQVALNWLLWRDGVLPIPGAKRPEHVESNAGGAGWTPSKAERAKIEAAVDAVRIERF